MTRICTTVLIRRPPEQVFTFVTTPANWPRWHPSSLRVSDGADHPLEVGEEVTEDFRVAGRRGRTVWTVCECQAPAQWVIRSAVRAGTGATITYTLTAHPEGTTFSRELVYTLGNPWHAVLNWLVLRRRVRAESTEALARLKAVLETEPQPVGTVLQPPHAP
jgi:uncharacterized protein YndB with AHSA1/START domain